MRKRRTLKTGRFEAIRYAVVTPDGRERPKDEEEEKNFFLTLQ